MCRAVGEVVGTGGKQSGGGRGGYGQGGLVPSVAVSVPTDSTSACGHSCLPPGRAPPIKSLPIKYTDCPGGKTGPDHLGLRFTLCDLINFAGIGGGDRVRRGDRRFDDGRARSGGAGRAPVLRLVSAVGRGGHRSQVRDPQPGLFSNTMTLTTSDCDALRIQEHQMALITSEWVPFSARPSIGAAARPVIGAVDARDRSSSRPERGDDRWRHG